MYREECGCETKNRSGEKKLSERVNHRMIIWYGHMVWMDEESMTKAVWKAKISGVMRVRERPRKGSMEGVERALKMRDLSVE